MDYISLLLTNFPVLARVLWAPLFWGRVRPVFYSAKSSFHFCDFYFIFLIFLCPILQSISPRCKHIVNMRQKVAEVGRPNNKSGFLLLRRPYDCVYCVAQPGLPLYAKSLGGQGVEIVRPPSGVRKSKEQASHPRTRIGYRKPTKTMENCSALVWVERFEP